MTHGQVTGPAPCTLRGSDIVCDTSPGGRYKMAP
jgi:hypothetical protein